MELKPIFVDGETSEGLYAIQYPENDEHEFERLFDLWNDAEYVHNYCLDNQEYLADEHFEGSSIDSIEIKIVGEAIKLETSLEDLTAEGSDLQAMFKPLSIKESEILVLQQSKAKANKTHKPILRIYGIRLNERTFVVTGGAIKLTRYMKDHPDTQRELDKLKMVKTFLSEVGINTEEDLIYYYES